MNPDGTGERRLTEWPGAEQLGAVSPDGEWIIFSNALRDGDPQHELYVVNVRDGRAALVAEGSRSEELHPTSWTA
jgi:Tol biopolymer transport system component